MQELPALPPGIRSLTDAEYERLARHYENLPPSPDRGCITCNGTGEFRWWSYDEQNDHDSIEPYKCDCISQYTLHLYLLNANIGLAYQRLGWRDVQVEPGALASVKEYIEYLPENMRSGCGLVLSGAMGTGKTLLATLTLKKALALGIDGYFTTMSEMIETFTSGWYDLAEKTWFHRRIKNAGLLVLDDIGRERKSERKNSLPESTFDEVLRHRVASALPTIITTNITESQDMAQGYGLNILSLLFEASTTYRFSGEDFRLKGRLKDRGDQERKQHLIRPVVLE